jgi:hypothetical protein
MRANRRKPGYRHCGRGGDATATVNIGRLYDRGLAALVKLRQ